MVKMKLLNQNQTLNLVSNNYLSIKFIISNNQIYPNKNYPVYIDKTVYIILIIL